MVDQDYVQLPAAVRKQPAPSFYIGWVLLTMLCIPLGFFLSFIPISIIIQFAGDYIVVNGVRHITEDYLAPYIMVPMIGLLTGICQYLLLRSHLPRMGAWIWSTLGGWLLGFLLIAMAAWLQWIAAPISPYVIFPCMGLGIGLAQWLMLRRRLPGAWIWIIACLLGWGLLAATTSGNAINQYGLFILGFFPACATAGALWWLMKTQD